MTDRERCQFWIPLDSRGRRVAYGERRWSERQCKNLAMPGESRCHLHLHDDGR